MNWYPQLQSGAVTQFPLNRDRRWRVIENELEGGERVALADTNGGTIGWNLSYVDLNDAEVGAIAALFQSSFGRYGSFGFVDPLRNFVAGSENLSVADWRKGAMTVTSGVGDPLGTTRAWQVTNGSAGDQDLAQTLSFPGVIQACFSVYVRARSAGTLRIRRDSTVTSVAIGGNWRRVWLRGAGDAGAQTADFALRLAAGQSVDVWGFQVEAQPFPSKYCMSVRAGGVYPQTNFSMDELRISKTAPGLSACQIELTSRT